MSETTTEERLNGWRLDLVATAETDGTPVAQGHFFKPVATDLLCGARDLSACRLQISLDHHVLPHFHNEDRLVFVRSGHAATLMMSPGAETWEHALVTGAGDIVFIPARWPHQAICLSTRPVRAVEISGDARFNHSVTLAPHLDQPEMVAHLRHKFTAGDLPPGSHPLRLFHPVLQG